MLTIKNLSVSVDSKKIINRLSLQIRSGQIHALMGPNGSGKSTLAYALAGHPDYHVNKSSKASLNRKNLLNLAPHQRAQSGLFLAFQQPISISGVSVQNFLKTAYEATLCTQCEKGDHVGDCPRLSVLEFRQLLQKEAKKLDINPNLLTRSLNENFSGGEKKRIEILQMAILKPKYTILDETDSGLDIDSLKIIAQGIHHVIKTHHTGVLLITHYRRILDHLKPHHVHIMLNGQIIKSNGPKLIHQLEKTGYKAFNNA